MSPKPYIHTGTFPIFDKLGGQVAVFNKLKRRRFPIAAQKSIYMWIVRESLPPHTIIALWKIALAEGITVAPKDFIFKDKRRHARTSPPPR